MPEIKETSLVSSDLIQSLIRAQKTFKMYPPNNPIYGKAVEEVYRLLVDRMGSDNQLALRFSAQEIHIGDDLAYRNDARQDNYALFFYRDGIRQLTFKSGTTVEEVEQLLLITSKDLDRQVIDDDLVTLLWEKDFEHIEYLATSDFLVEEDYDPGLEKVADKASPGISDQALREACEEAPSDAERVTLSKSRDIAQLTEQDLRMIDRLKEQEEMSNPLPTIVNILFALFLESSETRDAETLGRFLGEALERSLRQAEFEQTLKILQRQDEMLRSGSLPPTHMLVARNIDEATRHLDTLKEMGEVLDSNIPVNVDALLECAVYLAPASIPPLLNLLGTLQNMNARRLIMDVLAVVGPKDLGALTAGLRDKRWFVVRNTILVLGKIGDVRSVDTLGRCITHEDSRVRKETFRALGAMGGSRVLPHLKKGLMDRDPSVRISAVKGFRGLGDSDVAMRILLEEADGKDFGTKSFEEKKEFFALLSQWEATEVSTFLLKTLGKKAMFNRSKNEELRACAAHALGLMKKADLYIPELEKAASSAGELLRNEIRESLRKLRSHV